MNSSISEKLIDFVLDTIDLYEKNKKRSQIILSALLLGSSCGFASAAFVPETPDTDLLLASVIYEEQQTQTTTEASMQEESSITYSDTELQQVYEQVILSGSSDLCTEKLTGKYVSKCESYFWGIQASLQADASLCENIQIEEEKNTCNEQFSTDNPLFSMDDTQIQIEAEKCLSIEGQANQDVCWNSLFLSVAINKGDTAQCDNIKDEKTLNLCKERAGDKVDEQTKEQAIASNNILLCKQISSSSTQKTCEDTVLSALLEVTAECNEACIDQKAFKLATENEDPSICKKAATQTGITTCSDSVYSAIAKTESNSSFCKNISDESKANVCKNAVLKNEDKNPEVQASVFKEADRAFPTIGTALVDPFQDSLSMYNPSGSQDVSSQVKYTSVLDTLNNLESQEAASISTSVCKIYTTVSQRSACEDSLILQAAIPNKDIAKCSFIQDETTREYCELEIVQGDAIRAANEAKEKCYSLSSASAQQKCLKNTGFLTQTVSATDCLDYADPVDRIACMRENKISSEEAQSPQETVAPSTSGSEELDVIDDLDEIESIIEESLIEVK